MRWSLLLQEEVGDRPRPAAGSSTACPCGVFVGERRHAHADPLAWWEAAALRRHRDHRRRVRAPSSTRLLLVQRVRAAGEDGAAGEVGEVRPVGRLRGVVEDVAVGALERLDDQLLGRAGGCGAVRLVERGSPGPAAARRATAGSRRGSWRSRGSACWRATGRSTPRTARGRCPVCRPTSVSVLVWPGTTSFLPESSGTQKLWITLQVFAAPVPSQALRCTKTSRPVGMISSSAVTTLASGYENCHHHCLPSTVTCSAAGPGFWARSKMVATVGTAMMASSSAGRIVHPISSLVLPWICFGFSFLPGAVAELHRQHDGGDDDRDADDDGDDQDRDEEVVDLLGLRDPWAAASSGRCS